MKLLISMYLKHRHYLCYHSMICNNKNHLLSNTNKDLLFDSSVNKIDSYLLLFLSYLVPLMSCFHHTLDIPSFLVSQASIYIQLYSFNGSLYSVSTICLSLSNMTSQSFKAKYHHNHFINILCIINLIPFQIIQ